VLICYSQGTVWLKPPQVKVDREHNFAETARTQFKSNFFRIKVGKVGLCFKTNEIQYPAAQFCDYCPGLKADSGIETTAAEVRSSRRAAGVSNMQRGQADTREGIG
jgi:hypothetical protein